MDIPESHITLRLLFYCADCFVWNIKRSRLSVASFLPKRNDPDAELSKPSYGRSRQPLVIDRKVEISTFRIPVAEHLRHRCLFNEVILHAQAVAKEEIIN